ncbi:MAG: hypothetical protein LBH35_08475 [Treponema sp.]|jgi:hypothetical protein|nr:hypothetical protein [Treponema sp.]
MKYHSLYIQKKQQLIQRFNGIEESILALERSIQQRPTASRAWKEIHGYASYRKSSVIEMYDTLMFPKYSVNIYYLVHEGTVVLLDID